MICNSEGKVSHSSGLFSASTLLCTIIIATEMINNWVVYIMANKYLVKN